MAARFPSVRRAWDRDAVILYHLGLGAGTPPTDACELRYVYEAVLEVLPTFAVVPASDSAVQASAGPGLDYDPDALLQGEQEIVLYRTVPAEGVAVTTARVEAVYDKGSAAVVVVRADSVLGDGSPLSINRFTLFVRGEGGFGGDRGPKVEALDIGGPPDAVFEMPTLPQQAAIYRLMGDRTPLHIDPAAARRAGVDRPTLPGLCTWGMLCKGVVDRLFDGDVGVVGSFGARFVGSVYPGETLQVRAWRQGNRVVLDAIVAERGTPALSHVVLTLR